VNTNSNSLLQSSSSKAPLGAAYTWLLLFMVIYCARPEDWIPGLAAIPLAKVTAILAFLALLLGIGQVRRKFPRELIYLILLLVQLWLTVPLSPVWKGGAFQGTLDFSKVILVGIVIVLASGTMKRLRYLVLAQSVSVAVIAVLSVVRGRLLGGRLEGVGSGQYSNPNDLALAIVVNLPLCLVFMFRSRTRAQKTLWAIAMLVMVYAVLLTSSRGGLITLVVVIAACLWDFAIKERRPYLLAVTAIAGVVFSVYAANQAINRFNSEDRSATESREERKALLIKSLEVTAQHPLFGIGLGNFEVMSGRWRVAHNSYTQVSSEGGLPALILYLLILGRGFANVKAIKRMVPRGGELGTFASGVRASLLAFVVGSFFASVPYHFFTYFLVFYTTILYQISRRESAAVVRTENARSASLPLESKPAYVLPGQAIETRILTLRNR
jgi:O-antigen ligase